MISFYLYYYNGHITYYNIERCNRIFISSYSYKENFEEWTGQFKWIKKTFFFILTDKSSQLVMQLNKKKYSPAWFALQFK